MLRSLELFGFKSFADRTRFEFPRGITGIVGPNGSGKSNVVDALKWILGDQSAKSLRGKEMTDVVFNGAAGRKPSNLAEATLTFDNSAGLLPIESQDIRIGRRIWRSGDSEYLINGAPARLKDIRELFMGTGAGSAAYCIIEQGRVDQILQANAVSRRHIFEEAAGISRYKSRKIEALRKLERVDQNLLRLTDIVDEVEAQLNSVRSQAEKAARYRELADELRALWLGLAADDYRLFSSQLEQRDAAVAVYHSELAQLATRLEQLEGRLASLDAEIADYDDRLRTVDKKNSANRETLARHESTIRHETARQRELDIEVARLFKQRAAMQARIQEAVAERERIKGQRDRFEADFEQRWAHFQNRKEDLQDLTALVADDRRHIEEDRQTLLAAIKHVSTSENRVGTLRSQVDAARNARGDVESRLDSLDRQIDIGRAERNRLAAFVGEAAARESVADQAIRAIERRQSSLVGEQGEFRRVLAAKREQRSALVARKSVLDDLEQRQEGFGIGVKEILRRAQTTKSPPWNHIRGTVADLLEVGLEDAALLEVALGSRAQLIVIDEIAPLIEYLSQGQAPISGRVGFIAHKPNSESIHAPPPTPHDLSRPTPHDLSEFPGVRCRADQLAAAPNGLTGLAARLLADTWVVETLEVAVKLAGGEGQGCRFVTLQGELLDSDGSVTVGTVRSESAVVSRKSELRRSKSDIARLGESIEADERRLGTLDHSIGAVDGELQAAGAEKQKRAAAHAQLKAKLAAHEQHLERQNADRDSLGAEIARIDSQQEQAGRELEAAESRRAECETELGKLQAHLQQTESEAAANKECLEAAEKSCTEAQLELAKHEERLTALRTAYERVEQDTSQRIQQSEEAERRCEIVEAKRCQCALQILNTNSILAELSLLGEQLVADAAALSAEKDVLRQRRAKLLEEETGIRKQRRELGESLHREEIKAADLRHRIAALEQRIDEEYQLELTDVVASGASALRVHAHSSGSEPPVDSPTEDDLDPHLPVEAAATAFASGGDPATDELRERLEARVQRLRRKLKLMGNVNTDSLRDLDELADRYSRLSTQLKDLVEAKNALDEIVRRINAESKRLFSKTFDSVRAHFQDLFRKMFGGGNGDILLEDPEDVLDCGVDIVARPPGKEMKSISLMSGGEKTLTALALLLAIFKSRPSPYCVLDEVDAALDEANVDRLLALLEEFKGQTQFILITHKKPTMTIADVLYGVTMEESGVSKRVSVRFEDVRENGEFNVPATMPSADTRHPSLRRGAA